MTETDPAAKASTPTTPALPLVLTEAMRHAAWKAQFLHQGATDNDATLLAIQRVRDPRQAEQDAVAFAAMMGAA